jgi:hypothetical protein
VKKALPGVWLPYFKDDTAIILDLSDMAKPKAVKMDYLATVRDGSTGELVNGYWLLEIYASLSRYNPVPILLEPFSHQEPDSLGKKSHSCSISDCSDNIYRWLMGVRVFLDSME